MLTLLRLLFVPVDCKYKRQSLSLGVLIGFLLSLLGAVILVHAEPTTPLIPIFLIITFSFVGLMISKKWGDSVDLGILADEPDAFEANDSHNRKAQWLLFGAMHLTFIGIAMLALLAFE